MQEPLSLGHDFPWSIVAQHIDAARRVLGFRVEEDCFAAVEFERLLYDASLEERYVGLEHACLLLEGGEICVAGGSKSLESRVERIRRDCTTIIAVDGATTLLLEHGVEPSIIVGDLDGRWSSILEASRRGALVLAHAHGDNIATLRTLIPLLEKVAGSSQCEKRRGLFSLPPIGFTDGDRALGFILLCSSVAGVSVKGVRLFGMNFSEGVGWWSKPWLKESVEPWREKKVKLSIGEKLVELFAERLKSRRVEVLVA